MLYAYLTGKAGSMLQYMPQTSFVDIIVEVLVIIVVSVGIVKIVERMVEKD